MVMISRGVGQFAGSEPVLDRTIAVSLLARR